MPHSARDLGVFDPREKHRTDTLNRFEHWWAMPDQFVLLLFGFANAGVPFAQIGPGTYYVVAGLLFGKPIGILLFTRLARVAGGTLPPGLGSGALLVVSVVAAIGFTVSLLFATAAFPAGAALAETKMGALLSFVAAPLALLVSRMVRWRGFSAQFGAQRTDATSKVTSPSEGRSPAFASSIVRTSRSGGASMFFEISSGRVEWTGQGPVGLGRQAADLRPHGR